MSTEAAQADTKQPEPHKTAVGSYFVSNYPPYSQWQPEFVPAAREALAGPAADVPLGLYLHIPFCRKRCKFCYFRVVTDKSAGEVERYVAALAREVELLSQQAVLGVRPFRFVYFGGGTPSFLSAKQLTSLVDRLKANISWDLAEEVTFECEPGTLSQPKLETLRGLGITRLSLGVENFSDAVLEENGRAHLSGEIDKAWGWIQALGFPNTNIDLIAGMVGETWDNWRRNIDRDSVAGIDAVARIKDRATADGDAARHDQRLETRPRQAARMGRQHAVEPSAVLALRHDHRIEFVRHHE